MAPNNDPKDRIKGGLLYICYGFFAGERPVRMIAETEYKALAALSTLPGYAMYRLWKHKYLSKN